MEDEIILQEKIMLLEAQYDYMWENLNMSTKSVYGKSRKEILSELNKEINYYKDKLDKARTLNQVSSTLEMYKNLINNYSTDNTTESITEQEFIEKDIIKLETFLSSLQDSSNNKVLLNWIYYICFIIVIKIKDTIFVFFFYFICILFNMSYNSIYNNFFN